MVGYINNGGLHLCTKFEGICKIMRENMAKYHFGWFFGCSIWCLNHLNSVKIKVFVRTESVLSNNFLSMRLIVLRRVYLYFMKKWQWRKKSVADAISLPQLHKELIKSWKLCLNLCPCKWLRPSLSLEIKLIPLGLWHL